MRGAAGYGGGCSENGDEQILGRGENDHERIFPKYTNAKAASTDQVTVNGKILQIWEFSQLETLKPAILRSRAMAIRDAVGEASCPQMPSAQSQDMIRWILHMQSVLCEKQIPVCRNAMRGSGPSPSFVQETQGRPIHMEGPSSPGSTAPGPKPLPFGPRIATGEMDALRDHYGDLLERRREFKEAEPRGIATMRVGGEGRRHIYPKNNMINDGVSAADPVGLMKEQGEGRRHLECKDNLFVQQRELEGIQRGVAPESRRPRQGPESMRCGGQGMARILNADAPNMPRNSDPIDEMPIGGERKKHIMPEDHMLNDGTADAVEGSIGHGRKHIDTFAGRTQMSGTQDGYRPTWKQDPSRLMGTSLII